MPEVVPAIETFAKIVVAGIGGGGGKVIDRMIEHGVKGVDFLAINTDAQDLHLNKAQYKLHIGRETTHGLGAGADPEVGREAGEESRKEIKKALKGADMAFVIMCAGGGTGSGAGPIVAQVAQELGILTVGFATRPFAFEGEKRRRNADTAIANMREHVDTLITIPNDRLLQTIDRKTPLLEAFGVVDDILRQGVQGISDLITIQGLINLDFADVRTIMSNAGSALMGIGTARGDDRAIRAAKEAIESPLLEVSIDGARGVLFSVTGGKDMAMHEINEAAEAITAAVDPDANIIFGANVDESLEGVVRITVIATGFDAAYHVEAAKREVETTGLSYFNKPQEGEDEPAPADSGLMPGTTVTADDNAASDDEEETEEVAPAAPTVDEDVWSFNDDDDDFDVPAFVRNKDKKKKDKKKK